MTIGALAPGTAPDAVLAHVATRLTSIGDGSIVLVACSGGPDSTALAVLVRAVRPDLRLVLAHVAHGLRTSADDRRETEAVARLGAALAVGHVVLPVTVVRTGRGPEADARDVRHRALEVEAARHGAAAVLFGHHAEDQAETVLLRLARGAGSDGLAAMAPVAGLRVRPLLDLRRADVHCAARSIAPGLMACTTHDPMNDDPSFTRVRARREVLPLLATLGPDPVAALTRTAALARDEVVVLDLAVDRLLASTSAVRVGPATVVPSDALRAAPAAVARRLVRRLLGPLDASSVERLRVAPDGWRATLPGPVDVSVGRGWHIVRPVDTAVATGSGFDGAVELAPTVRTPVELDHPASSLRLRGDLVGSRARAQLLLRIVGDAPLPPGLVPARRTVRLRHAGVPVGPLTVRTRRPGDRIRLAGGTRTLADVMGEAGVPRPLRDLLPVVVDADGRPRWVPGLAVDVTVHEPSA